MTHTEQPFARGQEKAFVTGPFLGGYIYVTTASVLAAGTIAFNHPLRTIARHVEVVGVPIGTYPSRVTFSTNTRNTATVQFESAQPSGVALWIW